MSTKQIAFVADKDTVELLKQLQKELNAPTTAAVFRKAIALTQIAVDQSRASNGIVTLRGRGQKSDEEVSVALRA